MQKINDGVNWPYGWNLKVRGFVTAAQVRPSGILCHFQSPRKDKSMRLVFATVEEYLLWLDQDVPIETAMLNATEEVWGLFKTGYPK